MFFHGKALCTNTSDLLDITTSHKALTRVSVLALTLPPYMLPGMSGVLLFSTCECHAEATVSTAPDPH